MRQRESGSVGALGIPCGQHAGLKGCDFHLVAEQQKEKEGGKKSPGETKRRLVGTSWEI